MSFKIKNAELMPERISSKALDNWLANKQDCIQRIKHNSKRSVFAVSDEPGDAPSIYIKHEHPKNFRDKFKGVVRPKVKLEYQDTLNLYEQNIPVTKPLMAAWNGINGIFVSEAINQTISLKEWFEDSKYTASNEMLSKLHILLDSLLKKNFYHPDLHASNILCKQEDGLKLYLVDTYGVQQKKQIDYDEAIQMILPLVLLLNKL